METIDIIIVSILAGVLIMVVGCQIVEMFKEKS